MVVFPEMAYFSAPLKACPPVTSRFAALCREFGEWAKALGIYLLPGSLREPASAGRHFNTLPVFGPDGNEVTRYRKVFLFKARLPDRSYDESHYTDAGGEVTTFTAEGICFGLAICYDLRFPELFRSLKKRGAQVVFLPSAFTVPTGKAHWEALTRARAIENQFTLAAPGLTGTSGNGAKTYGHSIVVDAWGKVRALADTKPRTLFLQYDAKHGEDCRSRVDPWASRRDDLFP